MLFRSLEILPAECFRCCLLLLGQLEVAEMVFLRVPLLVGDAADLFQDGQDVYKRQLYTSANGDFEISISGRMRAPFAPGYPYFDIRLCRNSVIALSGQRIIRLYTNMATL